MKNIFMSILAPIMVCGVAGCASVSTPMKHTDGRVINCSAMGIGWIGAPAALIMRENCVSNARTNGFVPLDEGGPATATGAAKAAAAYPGKATISLPDGWVRATPPAAYASAIDYAKNATYDAYMLLSYINKKDVTDVAAYAETKKAAQVSKLRDATATETTKTDIKGRTAYVNNIEGILPSDGSKLHFRRTVVDDGGEILLLSVWTTAANYDGKVKEQLDGIANGLNGL
jgi:hypothetical protein